MRRRELLCVAIGFIALLTSVLALGGALRWIQATVAFLVAAAAATQFPSKRSLTGPPPILVLLGLSAVFTAFQVVPLPHGLVHALDPAGVDLRSEGAVLAGTHPWSTLSLDPPGSIRALAHFVTLFGVAVLAVRIAVSERGRYFLLAGIAIVCGLAAAVTGVHTLLNATSVYGIYKPLHATTPLLGPLLNPNHLGGLCAMGTIVAIGLAFYARQAAQLRVLWVVIAIGCLLITLASTSRGAVVGLVLGLAVMFVLIVMRKSTHDQPRKRRLLNDVPIAIVIGLGLAIATYTSAGSIADQLADTSVSELNQPVSKYAAWKSSMKLVAEAPLVGVGRGAIESNLTRVHEASAYVTFSHLENEYLTAVVEWGIPAALVLVCGLVWFIRVAIRRRYDGPLAAAAFGALTMIMFQSAVDFGVELLGVAVPAIIIASTLQVTPLREVKSSTRTRLARILLVFALVASGFAVLLTSARSLQEDHDALVAETSPSLDSMLETIQRHPTDYFAFGLAADSLYRAGDPRGVLFLNHALLLHPWHSGLHRLAARMLVGSKRYDQAAVEYRLALQHVAAPRPLLEEMISLLPSAELIARAIPPNYPTPDLILHTLADLKRLDISELWLEQVAAQPQHDLDVIDELYDLAMSRQDLDAAERAATLRLTVSHTRTSRLKLARAQFLKREFDPILRDFGDVERWTDGRTDERRDAWLLLCDVHIEQRDWDKALECIHHLDSSGLAAGGERAEITKRLEIIQQQRTYESKMAAIKAMQDAIRQPAKKP